MLFFKKVLREFSGIAFKIIVGRGQYSFASKVTGGHSQYRNAVASGRRCASIIKEYRIHPTLPRYGTDLFQAAIRTLDEKVHSLQTQQASRVLVINLFQNLLR